VLPSSPSASSSESSNEELDDVGDEPLRKKKKADREPAMLGEYCREYFLSTATPKPVYESQLVRFVELCTSGIITKVRHAAALKNRELRKFRFMKVVPPLPSRDDGLHFNQTPIFILTTVLYYLLTLRR
jgi:hypothetical protein